MFHGLFLVLKFVLEIVLVVGSVSRRGSLFKKLKAQAQGGKGGGDDGRAEEALALLMKIHSSKEMKRNVQQRIAVERDG